MPTGPTAPTRKLDEFVAERRGGGDADVLHIACFATIGPFFIPRLVRTFLEKAPDTMFQFFEGSEREIEEANRSSPFDLILMYDSPALPECSKESWPRSGLTCCCRPATPCASPTTSPWRNWRNTR